MITDKILQQKHRSLQAVLKKMGHVLLAFSGGIDSTLLLKAAAESLGDNVLAVTAVSPTLADDDQREAAVFARELGVPHLTVETKELDIPEFVQNPPEKCYICKKHRFGRLTELAQEKGIPWVADGENADDAADYRPGSRAAKELGVRSPLREAGFTKSDIRELAKALGLAAWNRPASACLASRIPYGTSITPGNLKQVADGEKYIRELGLSAQVRVRHEGRTARIEIAPESFGELVKSPVRENIIGFFKSIGFAYIALDLEGYRTGSLNRILENG